MKEWSLILILFFVIEVSAQSTFNYRLDFDRSVPSILTSIEVTDSCFYVCGVTIDTLAPSQLGSLFAKINLNGEVIWSKYITDQIVSYETSRNTLFPTPDGNFFVTGVYSDTISSGSLLIKYSPEGDTLFTRKYLSPYYPSAPFTSIPSCIMTSDSGLLLVNNIQNPISLTDIYVIKTDSLGNIEWDEIYGGSALSEISYSVLLEPNNNLSIGALKTNANFENNNYVARTYLFQIDDSGDNIWEYLSPEGDLQHSAFDFVPTDDGGYVIASGKGIEFQSGPNSLLWWDLYVFKINADREFVWGVDIRDTIASPDNSFYKMIAASDGSGYVAAGSIFEFTGGGGYNINGIISKISNEGDSLWTRYYNHVDSPADTHAFYDLEATHDSGYIMVGQATDHLLSGELPLQQSWIVKLDQHGCLVPGCHLIDDIDEPITKLKLSLYPNPASDYLNVFYYNPNHHGKVDFRVVDLKGNILIQFTSTLNNITHIVSLDNLPVGQYFLTMENKGRVIAKSFVVGR